MTITKALEQMNVNFAIRKERAGDEDAIRELTTLAFAGSELGHHGEAELVERLRGSCAETVSLVAEIGNRLVGHVLFTPVVIEDSARQLRGMGLAPLSVLPEFQRQGIGSRLIESGLEILREAKVRFVVVLGHPHYYPRFGFIPASRYGIKTMFAGIADEKFMINVLSGSAADIIPGVAKYRLEFDAVGKDS